MSLHRRDNEQPPSQAVPFSMLPCFYFRKVHPQITCRQCSPCDYLEKEWDLNAFYPTPLTGGCRIRVSLEGKGRIFISPCQE